MTTVSPIAALVADVRGVVVQYLTASDAARLSLASHAWAEAARRCAELWVPVLDRRAPLTHARLQRELDERREAGLPLLETDWVAAIAAASVPGRLVAGNFEPTGEQAAAAAQALRLPSSLPWASRAARAAESVFFKSEPMAILFCGLRYNSKMAVADKWAAPFESFRWVKGDTTWGGLEAMEDPGFAERHIHHGFGRSPCVGFVVVIDSTANIADWEFERTLRIDYAKSMEDREGPFTAPPMLFLVNRIDGAPGPHFTAERIAEELKLSERELKRWCVRDCCARTGGGLDEALQWLVAAIFT